MAAPKEVVSYEGGNEIARVLEEPARMRGGDEPRRDLTPLIFLVRFTGVGGKLGARGVFVLGLQLDQVNY